MTLEQEARFIAAVMNALGAEEMFIGHEHFFQTQDAEIRVHEDFERDGRVYRIRYPGEVIDAEVIEDGPKEIEQ